LTKEEGFHRLLTYVMSNETAGHTEISYAYHMELPKKWFLPWPKWTIDVTASFYTSEYKQYWYITVGRKLSKFCS
jgi:hypothetical protein